MSEADKHVNVFRERTRMERARAIGEAYKAMRTLLGDSLDGAKIEYPNGDEENPILRYDNYQPVKVIITTIREDTFKRSTTVRFIVDNTPFTNFGEALAFAKQPIRNKSFLEQIFDLFK